MALVSVIARKEKPSLSNLWLRAFPYLKFLKHVGSSKANEFYNAKGALSTDRSPKPKSK